MPARDVRGHDGERESFELKRRIMGQDHVQKNPSRLWRFPFGRPCRRSGNRFVHLARLDQGTTRTFRRRPQQYGHRVDRFC